MCRSLGWGSFVAPADVKTSEALAKALDKLDSSIGKACGPVNAFYRDTIFACPGAATDDDFKNCIACGAWDSALNILQAQYAETGTLVSPGTNALQTAVDAAGPNAKLLVKEGLYQEVVSITSNVAHSGTQPSVAAAPPRTARRSSRRRPGGRIRTASSQPASTGSCSRASTSRAGGMTTASS